MNRMATSDYGILAEYENIVTSSYQSGYCLPNGAVVLGSPSAESLENSTSSSTRSLLNADQMCYGAANGDCYGNMGSRECYGSFKNSSMSTIERYLLFCSCIELTVFFVVSVTVLLLLLLLLLMLLLLLLLCCCVIVVFFLE